jgi:hypothetical protein
LATGLTSWKHAARKTAPTSWQITAALRKAITTSLRKPVATALWKTVAATLWKTVPAARLESVPSTLGKTGPTTPRWVTCWKSGQRRSSRLRLWSRLCGPWRRHKICLLRITHIAEFNVSECSAGLKRNYKVRWGNGVLAFATHCNEPAASIGELGEPQIRGWGQSAVERHYHIYGAVLPIQSLVKLGVECHKLIVLFLDNCQAGLAILELVVGGNHRLVVLRTLRYHCLSIHNGNYQHSGRSH